jgi:crossover junction endodeoxyribonuclease RuvC
MRILGIDPGLAAVGWGFIVYPEGGPRDVQWGEIRTASDLPTARRLQKIYRDLEDLIRNLRPEAVSIEELFFAANVRTAIIVAQARGAAILATAESRVDVVEYTPLQIKKAVTGRGRAPKQQIQRMVATLLGLKETPRPDHAADALAAALCHGHTLKTRRLIQLSR